MKKRNFNNTSITFNFFSNVMATIFNLVIPLITIPYVSKILGAKGIGVYSYCLSIETYFIVMGTLGIPLYAQREIAKVNNDFDKTSEKFSEILILQIFLGVIALILYYITINFLNDEFFYMFLICGFGIIAALFDVSWLYSGKEKFNLLAKKTIIFKIISTVLIFMWIKDVNDIYLYAFSIMLSNFICNISLFILSFKEVKFKFPSISNFGRILKSSFIIMLPSLVTTIYAVIDETMIGSITGNMNQVGLYEQAQKIIFVINTLVSSIGVVLMPRLAHVYSQKKYEEFKAYIMKGLSVICFFSIPMAFGCFVISTDLVPWFFGKEFMLVEKLLKIFAFMIIFMGISNLISTQILISTNNEKKLFKVNLIIVFINLFFNSILIWRYGAIGAAISTVISEFIKCLYSLFIVRDMIYWKNFIYDIKKYLLISFIMAFIVCLFNAFLKNIIGINASWYSTFVLVIIGILIYFLQLLIIKDKWFLKVCFIVKEKINLIAKLIINKSIERNDKNE